MKKIVGIFLFCITALLSNAQPPEYDDLKILYADAKYEKLSKVADHYTQKEDLKKDPIPFLWLAKGLYKISLSGTSDEKFKNAYKDALAAMAKALKNDKDSSMMTEHNEFVNEFQGSLLELINNDIAAKDYNKASGWAMKYAKVSLNPVGAKYLDGAAKFRKTDKGGANTLWKEADAFIAKVKSIEEWTESDRNILKVGAFQAAECMISGKQVDKAKALLDKIAPWFKEDDDFKAKYDELFK